ncbi:MAG TPA: hypothetical protein VFN10_13295 [Thermoanaerobaculia bacterium]|nr:hypothetical protein [Thermoanaerobaculia bacterium]
MNTTSRYRLALLYVLRKSRLPHCVPPQSHEVLAGRDGHAERLHRLLTLRRTNALINLRDLPNCRATKYDNRLRSTPAAAGFDGDASGMTIKVL